MRTLYPYWRRYLKTIILALIFLSAEAVCDLLQPTIVSKIIDNGVKMQSIPVVLRMGGLMLLVTVIGACNAVGRSILASRVSQRFGANLRLDLFKKINGFSFETLSRHETATLITRATNDTTQLVNFTNGMMRVFFKSPILLIGCFVMVFLLNIRLALVLAAVVPIIIILIYVSMRVGYPYFIKMQSALDKNNSVIREYLSGVRVVKAYNTFEQEVERFDRSNTELTDISVSANRMMSVFTPIISFTINAGIVAALWFAREWVAGQNMQIGQMVAFINYMTQILFSLNMIFNVYQQFIRAKASAERVAEILIEDSEPTGFNILIKKPTGHIRFENVSFIYPRLENASRDSGTLVLRDISFELLPGEIMGVIGSTGAGKSSLVHLIPGFYTPVSGAILLDGLPLPSYDPVTLREHISLVAQQSILFYGTVAENIRMGKPDATMDEIIVAAKAAQAHDFIMGFPDGYETRLGQKGVNLSGGQKQRISIARALVRKANILILDDCVSAVDVETEAAIMGAISALSPAPACVMITQRISSVLRLPKILVLDEGKVAGYGNHLSLMENSPVYQEIYRSQIF